MAEGRPERPRTYRVGVIGHTGRGGYGHGLDLAFASLPGAEMVAVADPDDGGRAAALARTGARQGYADYREMLAREALDLVAIGPHWLEGREDQVLAAAAAGVRGLLIEKPFAGSVDSADRMLAACDAAGVQVAVAHQNRAFPAPRLAASLLDQGAIGRLRTMRAWTKADERGGGLELLIHGTHMFDLMRSFAGDARWCNARVTLEGRDVGREDAVDGDYGVGPIAGDDVVATYGFDGGITGSLESMRSADGGSGSYFRLELSGTSGVLCFWSSTRLQHVAHLASPFDTPDRPGHWKLLTPPAEIAPSPMPAEAGPMHAANHQIATSLVAAIEGQGRPLSSGHDGRAAIEMVVAAYASHLRQERVRLPLAERAHPLTGP